MPPPALDYEFIKADSIALSRRKKPRLWRAGVPSGCFPSMVATRQEHTFNDLLTAQDFLSPGGVLILDDFMQPHWPGVTEAVHNFYGKPRLALSRSSMPAISCFFRLWLARRIFQSLRGTGARPLRHAHLAQFGHPGRHSLPIDARHSRNRSV